MREEVLWNIPLIHLFDKDDILKVLHFKSDYPLRPHNEADVFYRKSRSDIYANVGMVNENGKAKFICTLSSLMISRIEADDSGD